MAIEQLSTATTNHNAHFFFRTGRGEQSGTFSLYHFMYTFCDWPLPQKLASKFKTSLWTSGIEHLLARRCIEHLMTLGVLACSELVVLVHLTYLNFILTSKLGAHGPMGLKFKDVSSHLSYFGSLRSISGNMPSQRRGVLLSLGLDTDTRWLEIFDQPKRIWLVLVSPAKVIGT